MAFGTLQAGAITPGSGATLTVSENVTFSGVATLPSPVINTAISGSAVLDEDNLASNSATKIATEQSIKAYADSIATAATSATNALKTNSSITTLGTVTAGNLSNAAIVYPANHVIYFDSKSIESGGQNSDPGSAWAAGSLSFVVPAATIALCSKMLVTICTSFLTAPATYSMAAARIRRTDNNSGNQATLAEYKRVGILTALYSGPQVTLQGIDTFYGAGVHEYNLNYSNALNDAAYAGTIYPHGDSGATATLTVMGIK